MNESSDSDALDIIELSSDEEAEVSHRRPLYVINPLPVKKEAPSSSAGTGVEMEGQIYSFNSPSSTKHHEASHKSLVLDVQNIPTRFKGPFSELTNSVDIKPHIIAPSTAFVSSVSRDNRQENPVSSFEDGINVNQMPSLESTGESSTVRIGLWWSDNVQTSPQAPSTSREYNDMPRQANKFYTFWKAGDYDNFVSRRSSGQGQMDHVRVHPKFLHSNATSHKWAFGAIAELLDNAVDEIPNGATFVKVDSVYNARDGSPVLLFQDDGGGMDPERMRHCMSLGYSSKKNNTTIGQYGNGFKTSTMRLGADVIVFSGSKQGSCATQSVGLLSYTFLRKTGLDDVIVPMIDFELCGDDVKPLIRRSQDDWTDNMNAILEWSPYLSEEELMRQFEDIGPHGTKIIIYNLWLNDDGLSELDFTDDEDIKLNGEAKYETLSISQQRHRENHISHRLRYSLRAYASILYLRKFTNFEIILRGTPVQQLIFADELKFSEVITYKPCLRDTKEAVVLIAVGFIKEAAIVGIDVHGFNVYHKNRLIMPFWRVYQDVSNNGRGVVGVLEANFIEPAHDKQDFEKTAVFQRLESRLKQLQSEYWKSHCHLIGYQFGKNTLVINQQLDNFPKQTIVGLAAVSAVSSQQTTYSVPATQSPAQFGFGVPLESNVYKYTNHHQRTQLPTDRPNVGILVQQPEPRMSEGAQNTVGEDVPVDSTRKFVERICEENIQLFNRCEHHRQNEAELKKKIEKLRNELEEGKKKCAELAAKIESHRKQNPK
ncbi:protein MICRORCHIDIA 2 isoform X1 [Amborella trichopoda]|nr:protein MICRORCHIDIA 2 isoform X1 [Amborella trichopoda]|eukprot:XP_011628917.1 protein MICRORCHIDIA 2 isoform X1 [Amborella trichopoda]